MRFGKVGGHHLDTIDSDCVQKLERGVPGVTNFKNYSSKRQKFV